MRGGPAKRCVKRARVFARTKGFRGRAKNCYSIAVRAAHRSMQFAYKGRKLKKRDMRECNIQLNRKVLSELAIHEPTSFQSLAEIARSRHGHSLQDALQVDDNTATGSYYETQTYIDDHGKMIKETLV